jgi:hypothetical protein
MYSRSPNVETRAIAVSVLAKATQEILQPHPGPPKHYHELDGAQGSLHAILHPPNNSQKGGQQGVKRIPTIAPCIQTFG